MRVLRIIVPTLCLLALAMACLSPGTSQMAKKNMDPSYERGPGGKN